MRDATDVRMVTLEPMRVAWTRGFGAQPEMEAWDKILHWMQEHGLDDDGARHRYFGFNDPSPSPGSPHYGYQQWVTVGPDAQPGGDVQIKDFPGGRYAVLRCTLGDITEAWRALLRWVEDGPYADTLQVYPHGFCLEECLTVPFPDPVEAAEFDLYQLIEAGQPASQ